MTAPLYFLHQAPISTADIRTKNSDFIVEEILPFSATGEGEHHLLHIRKDGLNTADVVKILSGFAHVHPKDVGYAGMKDKHAITEQWFGVRIPGKETPLWHELNSEQLTVLSSARHSKKLRIGALSGNRFTLTLRQVTDMDSVIERFNKIKESGVPNYFGEQRFGHEGKNLVFARQMFAGKRIKDRKKRGIYLSAIRSYLFNQLVSSRLSQYGVDKLAGDCMLLAGSKSYFVAEQWDQELIERLATHDILLSAPLWGRGEPLAKGEAGEFERKILAPFADDQAGLESAGLTQERRPLLLYPQQMSYKQLGDDVIEISFALPAGCYATSVLRELADYEDANERNFRLKRAMQQESENQN